MILYLSLIAISGLLIVVAVGTLIYGLVKKRRNVLITSAIIFAVGTIGCVFSSFMYTKKAIDYVRSDDFQNDAKRGSELIGQTAGSISSGVSSGLSSTLDDEAIRKLASKSGTILGKSIKTIASSLDSTLENKRVFVDQTLENSGIEVGRADEKFHPKTNDFEIFIDYKKDYNGKMRVVNYDQNGQKIEVVDKEIHSKAGQGKVEVFSFDHSDFGLTTYYIISKVE